MKILLEEKIDGKQGSSICLVLSKSQLSCGFQESILGTFSLSLPVRFAKKFSSQPTVVANKLEK